MGLGGGGNDYLKLGTWNAYCSECGRKRKADEMVRNWQGMYRCPEHNEPRQPQDFARGVAEHMEVPWAQPLADNNYVTGLCTLNGTSGMPGAAMPGCARPGSPVYDPFGV